MNDLERYILHASDDELLAALAKRGASSRRQAKGVVRVMLWLKPDPEQRKALGARKRRRILRPSERTDVPPECIV